MTEETELRKAQRIVRRHETRVYRRWKQELIATIRRMDADRETLLEPEIDLRADLQRMVDSVQQVLTRFEWSERHRQEQKE